MLICPTPPARLLIIGLLALLLVGCAAAPQWPTSTAPGQGQPRPLQQRVVLDQVPFYPQELYQCGPAALAMMLNSQGLNRHPEVLKELVYLPGREGSLQVEMVAAGRAHGMLVYPLDGTLDSLLTEVAAGNPVLVLQNLRFDWWPQWHFAVVVGFDAAAPGLILHTGLRDYYEMPLAAFSATWARGENWARVMLPPNQLPATAKPLTFLAAANDLEITGRTHAALTAYQTAERQWPDQPAAILGLGNAAYALGDLTAASEHFLRMTHRFPRAAEGWNNLAHTLAQRQCQHAAHRAQSCASALAPVRFKGPHRPLPEPDTNSRCPVLDCPVPTARKH